MPKKPLSTSSSPYFAPRNRVRIIGGTFRSRMIDFPDAHGLRPTPDRVRETLFNWLGQTLTGKHCLDLFAGSGALGFEAASRGAAACTLVETQRGAKLALEKSRDALKATNVIITNEDALQFLDRRANSALTKFDIVFLDPPFASDLLAASLKKIEACLAIDGVIYVECGQALRSWLAEQGFADWAVLKEGKAGQAHFALLSRSTP
jgi:16S rRNA (guanine966-N2)-methyltransferase